MDIPQWLKETVPGVIVLGAIGSIVAVAVLRAMRFLLMRFLPEQLKARLKREYRFRYSHGWVAGILSVAKHPLPTTIYFIYHATWSLLLALGATALGFAATQVMLAPQRRLLTVTSYTLVVLCMLALVRMARHLRVIGLSYRHLIGPLLKQAAESHDKKQDGNTTGEAADKDQPTKP